GGLMAGVAATQRVPVRLGEGREVSRFDRPLDAGEQRAIHALEDAAQVEVTARRPAYGTNPHRPSEVRASLAQVEARERPVPCLSREPQIREVIGDVL